LKIGPLDQFRLSSVTMQVTSVICDNEAADHSHRRRGRVLVLHVHRCTW